jgi:hypothetical protein
VRNLLVADKTIRTRRKRAALVLATAFVLFGAIAAPASAQGLFDFLFGSLRRALPGPPPPQSHPFVDPDSIPETGERPGASYGPAKSYCVRTCDGHFFPLPRHANLSPAQACQAFCPAAQTKIFSGSGIAHSVAYDGTRYADLPNAFVYRDKFVDGCTCNGQDQFGIARIEPNDDWTLRPGDIVATKDGLVSYRGERQGQALFTPIDKSAVLGGKHLSSIKVQER